MPKVYLTSVLSYFASQFIPVLYACYCLLATETLHSCTLHLQVVKKLQAMYGSLYTYDNVILSGTHTHSGPAGYFQYVLFEITSLGFVKESLDVTVDGIVKSISLGEDRLL